MGYPFQVGEYLAAQGGPTTDIGSGSAYELPIDFLDAARGEQRAISCVGLVGIDSESAQRCNPSNMEPRFGGKLDTDAHHAMSRHVHTSPIVAGVGSVAVAYWWCSRLR